MWLGQHGWYEVRFCYWVFYPYMKYAARLILCRFKQYLSVKLWSYCHVFGWDWKTRLQNAVYVAMKSNANHRVFLLQWKTNLTCHIEPINNNGTGLQIHIMYVPYMKLHIFVSFFKMLFLETNSKESGNQSSDCAAWKAESHIVTFILCN